MSGHVPEVSHLHKTLPNHLHIRAFLPTFCHLENMTQKHTHRSLSYKKRAVLKASLNKNTLNTDSAVATYTYLQKFRKWLRTDFVRKYVHTFVHTHFRPKVWIRLSESDPMILLLIV